MTKRQPQKTPPDRRFRAFTFSTAASPTPKNSLFGGPSGENGTVTPQDRLEKTRAFFPESSRNPQHFSNKLYSVSNDALMAADTLVEMMSRRVDKYTVTDLLTINFLGKDKTIPEHSLPLNSDLRQGILGLRKVYFAKTPDEQLDFLPTLNWSAKLVFVATLIADIQSKLKECLNEPDKAPSIDSLTAQAQFISKASIIASLDDSMTEEAVLYFNKLCTRTDCQVRLSWSEEQGCAFAIRKNSGPSSGNVPPRKFDL